MTITTDVHMHSTNSHDGKSTMREMCLAALGRGLTHICFTEHYDCNPHGRSRGYFSYDRYMADIEACRREFGDRIEILTGIEFGEPHKYPAELEKMGKLGFDVILGAVHRIEIGKVSTLAEDGFDPETLFRLYYEEVLAAVRQGGFHVMAHLDFPKRHTGNSCDIPELVDQILAAMIENDIVPEINTSTCDRDVKECCPDVPILARWAALGGNRVVVGSDAHATHAVARHFDEAERVLRETGLNIGFYKDGVFQSAAGSTPAEKAL